MQKMKKIASVAYKILRSVLVIGFLVCGLLFVFDASGILSLDSPVEPPLTRVCDCPDLERQAIRSKALLDACFVQRDSCLMVSACKSEKRDAQAWKAMAEACIGEKLEPKK